MLCDDCVDQWIVKRENERITTQIYLLVQNYRCLPSRSSIVVVAALVVVLIASLRLLTLLRMTCGHRPRRSRCCYITTVVFNVVADGAVVTIAAVVFSFRLRCRCRGRGRRCRKGRRLVVDESGFIDATYTT